MLNRYESTTNALRAFKLTGAAMPAEVQDAIDNQARISAFVGENSSHGLHTALLAAIAAGIDPAKDSDVTTATRRAVWKTAGGSLQQSAEAATVRAVAANADALIEAMRPAFDTAVVTLHKAHATLGDVDLRENHAQILSMGSKAATAWASAIAAVEVTSNIVSAWAAIAQTAGWSEALFAAQMVEWDAHRWVSLHHQQRPREVGADAWVALSNGWTLRLADSATLRKFETQIAEAEQRAREAAKSGRNRSAIFAGR